MRNRRSNVPKSAEKFTVFLSKEEMGLLDFVMKKLDGISRSKAKTILSSGGVMVDHKVQTRFDFNVLPDMVVEISKHPEHSRKLESQYFSVIYEDDDIIVVNKEAGVLSVGVGANSLNMKDLLDRYFVDTRQRCTAHVVHRLDCRTSGLMVYAKSVDVQQAMENNWQDIILDRRYVAVVSGAMNRPSGHIESWLKDTPRMVIISSRTDNGGKFASTDWKLLDSNDRYSLIELKLHTGRKNQIRVHMHDLHHPVVGDFKYGSVEDPLGRLGLHAFRLAFRHPVTGEPLKFETPFPQAFTFLMNKR
jgi:23S rRNA pseudouridine1911/1915/1917 synthase